MASAVTMPPAPPQAPAHPEEEEPVAQAHAHDRPPRGGTHAAAVPPGASHAAAGHAGGSHAHGHGAHGHDPHEAPWSMALPLILLAVGSIVAGYVGVPHALGGNNRIESFLEPSFAAEAHGADAAV